MKVKASQGDNLKGEKFLLPSIRSFGAGSHYSEPILMGTLLIFFYSHMVSWKYLFKITFQLKVYRPCYVLKNFEDLTDSFSAFNLTEMFLQKTLALPAGSLLAYFPLNVEHLGFKRKIFFLILNFQNRKLLPTYVFLKAIGQLLGDNPK